MSNLEAYKLLTDEIFLIFRVDLRGKTYIMELLILHNVFGIPLVRIPANALCSNGDKWYLKSNSNYIICLNHIIDHFSTWLWTLKVPLIHKSWAYTNLVVPLTVANWPKPFPRRAKEVLILTFALVFLRKVQCCETLWQC